MTTAGATGYCHCWLQLLVVTTAGSLLLLVVRVMVVVVVLLTVTAATATTAIGCWFLLLQLLESFFTEAVFISGLLLGFE